MFAFPRFPFLAPPPQSYREFNWTPRLQFRGVFPWPLYLRGKSGRLSFWPFGRACWSGPSRSSRLSPSAGEFTSLLGEFGRFFFSFFGRGKPRTPLFADGFIRRLVCFQMPQESLPLCPARVRGFLEINCSFPTSFSPSFRLLFPVFVSFFAKTTTPPRALFRLVPPPFAKLRTPPFPLSFQWRFLLSFLSDATSTPLPKCGFQFRLRWFPPAG